MAIVLSFRVIALIMFQSQVLGECNVNQYNVSQSILHLFKHLFKFSQ